MGDQEATDHLPVLVVCGMAFEAAIAAGPGVVTLCGPGAAGLARLCSRGAPAWRGIISFGTAGGLDPALRPGACVLADAIATPAGRLPVDAHWLDALRACLPDALQGTLAGVDRPLCDAAARAGLWRGSGACAVDMESHRAARFAQQLGLPFAACRVVADPAHRNLPPGAIAAMREDGTTALMPVLRALAVEPRQLAALLQVAADAYAARRSLRAARAVTGVAFAMPR
jgi:hopanoid-associated phosphorylase